MGNERQDLKDGTHIGYIAGQGTCVMVILARLRNSQDNQNDQQLNHYHERDFLNGGKGRTLTKLTSTQATQNRWKNTGNIRWRRHQGMESRKFEKHEGCIHKSPLRIRTKEDWILTRHI